MQLVIGNKNYSSWSMRPWVLLKQAGIAFDEVMVRFDAFTPGSEFKSRLASLSPTGRVPVLIDGDLTVWDTLAIAEYVAEKYPAMRLWPKDATARARARSVCAEMHSGFGALRSHFPMNVEASLAEVGARVLAEQAGVRADVERLVQMWTALLAEHRGPMLFGEFSVADAFFAPIVMRLRTYGVPVPEPVEAYMLRVCALPGVAAWIADALAEHDFLDFEEPYRAQA
ncbi:MAG TPA: glutathione S-transferase family protein [Burkholderiaceae bacterium]|jgi:glutathione S-transferase